MNDKKPGQKIVPGFSGAVTGNAANTSVVREPKSWEILQALEEVIQKIGHTRLIMASSDSSNWWEAFSHGLAMPVREAAMARIRNVEDYILAETDYLDLDEEGFRRKFGNFGLSSQEGKIGENQLKSLTLRVAAFLQLRKSLAEQGFTLPPNPAIEDAILIVQSELAKDASTLASWKEVAGVQQKQLPETTNQP